MFYTKELSTLKHKKILRQRRIFSKDCIDFASNDYINLSKNKINVHHLEGNGDSGWLIIDCYDLVINLFTNSERKRIDLDDIFATNKKIKEDN